MSWGYSFFVGRDEAGKRIQVTKSGFDTKREASDALRRGLQDHQAGTAVVRNTRTFAEFFEEWIREVAGRRCAPKTLERYKELGAYAVRKFGGVELQKLTPMLIEKALHELQDSGGRVMPESPKGKPLSARTVRHVAFTVNGCLDTAVRWGLLTVNPMSRVELPVAVKQEAAVLDGAKVGQALAAAAGTRLFPFIVLAVATGCRRGELLALQWADIDFKTGILSIDKSLEETRAGLRVKSTKSGKPRRFAVPARALEVLQEHQADQDRDRAMFGPDYQAKDLVFCKPDGTFYRPDSISCRVTEVLRKAGLSGASLHTLRHSHASELLSKGTPIPTVAKRLGHANANVTLSIYSHALEADELAAAKVWNDAMADVIQADRPTARTRKERR